MKSSRDRQTVPIHALGPLAVSVVARTTRYCLSVPGLGVKARVRRASRWWAELGVGGAWARSSGRWVWCARAPGLISSLRHGWFLLCGCGRRAGCHPHGSNPHEPIAGNRPTSTAQAGRQPPYGLCNARFRGAAWRSCFSSNSAVGVSWSTVPGRAAPRSEKARVSSRRSSSLSLVVPCGRSQRRGGDDRSRAQGRTLRLSDLALRLAVASVEPGARGTDPVREPRSAAVDVVRSRATGAVTAALLRATLPSGGGRLVNPTGRPLPGEAEPGAARAGRRAAQRLFRPVVSPGAVFKVGRLAGLWRVNAKGWRLRSLSRGSGGSRLVRSRPRRGARPICAALRPHGPRNQSPGWARSPSCPRSSRAAARFEPGAGPRTCSPPSARRSASPSGPAP